MIDSEEHPYVEWIAREARRSVLTGPEARDRVMTAVRAEPAQRTRRTRWAGLLAPRTLALSPVGGALLAAGLVGIGVIAGRFVHNRDVRAADGRSTTVAVTPQLPVSDTVVKFVFTAPRTTRVSLVGDFNDWDTNRTPLMYDGDVGVWTVTLPLSTGRHLYAFVVDGSWTPDPRAPLAPDGGFGHANSVKIVGGSRS
jgi:hypothetical protein